MASADPNQTPPVAEATKARGWSVFWTPRMLALVWLPILVIGVLHYGTGSEHGWAHNVLRRLYYLPIVVAAIGLGLRGGLSASLVVSLSYLPHAFLHGEHLEHLGHLGHADPAGTLEKALEIVLYNAVGIVAGVLADAERKRRVELRRALEEQQRLQRQLVRAGRLSALGQVVAGVAHEVRNPLHALKGTAEIVDPLIDSDQPERRMWQLHLAELERLEKVADRFLSFARPTPLETGPLDIRRVAERLVELAEADGRKKGISIKLDLPDGPVMVLGDQDQLAQVGLNIVLNAFAAIDKDGGTIRVRAARAVQFDQGIMQALIIENDGPPIAPTELEHLFDPFYSANNEGLGLGLSISERIVEQHGGYIEAANAGLGVTFTICLPQPEPSIAR